MKISNSAKYVIGVSAAVALLAGCTGNGGSQLTPTGNSMAPTAQRTMGANHKINPMTLLTPSSVHPNLNRKIRNGKMLKPNCCALQKTVFFTDAFGGSSFTGAVYAFDYVTGAYLGQVAAPPEGFLEVQGACSDNAGNVYFANTEMSTIDEYNHSGSFVTAISDPGQFPAGCAFDRSTGDLAVTNIITTSDGNGSVSIYHDGTLQNNYVPSNMFRVFFAGYMGKTGTLYFDGLDASSEFQYDSLSGGVVSNVGIHGATVLFPGTVAWSGKTMWMNVADQDTFSDPTLYQVDGGGNVFATTVLACEQASDFCDPVQMAIKGPGIATGDSIGVFTKRYAYPAGGSSTLDYTGPSYVEPIGAAVSPDKTSD